MKVKPMKSYTQTLPLDQWKQVSKLAADRGVSVSEYMRNVVLPRFLGDMPSAALRKVEALA